MRFLDFIPLPPLSSSFGKLSPRLVGAVTATVGVIWCAITLILVIVFVVHFVSSVGESPSYSQGRAAFLVASLAGLASSASLAAGGAWLYYRGQLRGRALAAWGALLLIAVNLLEGSLGLGGTWLGVASGAIAYIALALSRQPSGEPPAGKPLVPIKQGRDTNRSSRLVISSVLGLEFPSFGCGCALAGWLLLAQALIFFGFIAGVTYPIAGGIAGDALGAGTFLAFSLIHHYRRRHLGVSDVAIALGLLLALAIFIWSVRLLSEPSCPGCSQPR